MISPSRFDEVLEASHRRPGDREAYLSSYTAFTADHGDVYWASVRLSPQSVEDLFDIFQREGCVTAFNSLHDAHVAAGGIARVSSLRAAR